MQPLLLKHVDAHKVREGVLLFGNWNRLMVWLFRFVLLDWIKTRTETCSGKSVF